MNIDLETLSERIILDDCPILKKKIRKITLFYSNPDKYALYIEETDRFILISESEIDSIIKISKLTDGHTSIKKIIMTDASDNKDIVRCVLLMYKLHLFDNSQENNQFSETSMISKKLCAFSLKISDRNAGFFYFGYWILLFLIVIVLGIYSFFGHGNIVEHFQYNMNQFNGINYFVSLILTAPLFLIHEFAHVATACRYQLNRNLKIHIALYLYLIPYVYVKIPSLYTIKPSKRIHILISGVLANLLMGVMFVFLNVLTDENIFLTLALSNFQIFVVNLMPFNLTDGYFIFTNLLKSFNLRKNYFSFISCIPKVVKFNFDKIEWTYLIVSGSYLIAFIFFEARVCISSFFNDLNKTNQFLLNIFLTAAAIIVYIGFIKIRFKKITENVNEK